MSITHERLSYARDPLHQRVTAMKEQRDITSAAVQWEVRAEHAMLAEGLFLPLVVSITN